MTLALLQEYDIQSAEDIRDVLKELLGGTIKEMMETEMDDHLGMKSQVPQDRKSTFEPQVVKKRQKYIQYSTLMPFTTPSVIMVSSASLQLL